MRASAELGIKVPRLCATDAVDAFGSCRLCLVEIEGIERHSLLPVARDVPRQDSFIAQLAHAESQARRPLTALLTSA